MQEKVYFYATCLGSTVAQDMALAAMKLLRHFGVEIIFKQNQTCCGQPAFNSGFFNEAKKIAKYNVELFSQDLPIVVPSGSCAGMLSHDYKELLGVDSIESTHQNAEDQKINSFCSRVVELSQFLEQIGAKLEDKGSPIKITWHSNCHALRVQKCIESSKRLLAQLKNVELVELEYEAECCGFGGTFSVKEPEISNAMASAKVADIEKTGASFVISSDSGCLMNIKGTLSRQKSSVRGLSLYEFLLARITGGAL